MNPLHRGFRHLFGLPRRRFASRASSQWLAAPDGVRLATHVIRPTGAGEVPVVLIRTPLPVERPTDSTRFFARLLAEDGYTVVLQSCRGRYASEGVFEHFTHEASDGAATREWIRRQPWGASPLALVGFGYAGYAAWAALGAGRVATLAVGFQGRDPHATLYRGGALRLETALHLGVGIGENAMVPRRELDVTRGCEYRPVREADRVARRRVDSFRAWTEHPIRDGFWEALTPAVPESPPRALLIGGWCDPSIEAMLADHAALGRAAAKSGSAAPELVVGPWAGGRSVDDGRARRVRRDRNTPLRTLFDYLARTLRAERRTRASVSVFVNGARRWRDLPQWPPPATRDRVLHLHSNGRANGFRGDGRLADAEPAADSVPDRFTSDPEDPVRSVGAALRRAHGAWDQRAVEARDDVLCFSSDRLASDLDVMGPVRLVLFAGTNAPDGDFCARLVDVAPDGTATSRCEGIVRARWDGGAGEPTWFESDTPRRLTIELGDTASRFRAGHRLRLEIAGSNFPCFDRNPNTREPPETAAAEHFAAARQTVHHDATHPSRLVLRIADGSRGDANAKGPPA